MLVLKKHTNNQTFKAAAPSKTHFSCGIQQPPKSTTKISPIKVLYQKLSNTVDIQRKLCVKAYKCVTKVAAVGPNTAESLFYIEHSKNVKTIKSFEFDPYLCDSSCIPELIRAYPRLKKINGINLIIKRMDKQDIVTKKRLMLRKFNRLNKIRAELTYNGDFYNISPIFHLKDISRCYGVKSLTTYSIDLPFAMDAAYQVFSHYKRNLLRLEEFQMTKYRNYTVLNKEDEIKHKTPNFRLFNLKRFSFCLGNKPGWVSMEEDSRQAYFYLDNLARTPKMEDLNLKFLRYPSVLDFIVALIGSFPMLPNLKRLKLNFIKSPIGDIEIFELCQHLHKLVGIKQFTIKIFQYPNLSADAIRAFVKCLSEHPTIEVFDLYTRRLDIPYIQLDDLVNIIKSTPGVECVRFKQSLHAYKRKQKNLI